MQKSLAEEHARLGGGYSGSHGRTCCVCGKVLSPAQSERTADRWTVTTPTWVLPRLLVKDTSAGTAARITNLSFQEKVVSQLHTRAKLADDPDLGTAEAVTLVGRDAESGRNLTGGHNSPHSQALEVGN